MASFCSRCGAENPPIARHCGDCGALLEDVGDGSADAPALPASDEPEAPLTAPSVRCVRCGANTHESPHCPTCGALQPLPPHRDDPFIGLTLGAFPLLLRSPRAHIMEMPYRNDLRGILFPTIGITLAAAGGWTLAALPSLLPALPGGIAPLTGQALGQAMGAIALLGPWIFLGYAACWQGIAMIMGGTGTLERTARALAMLLIPTLILLGGFGAHVRLVQLLAVKMAPLPGADTSDFWAVYQVLPVVFMWGFILTAAVALAYHAIILAAANWMDQAKTIWLHVVLAVAVGIFVLIRR